MDEDTTDQLVHFAEHHLSPNGLFWFFGGEPFSHYESMKYIVEKAYAHGWPWRFGVTTNCTLLDEAKVKWAKKFGLGVLCSIDGPEEKHDKFRVYSDGRGSWNEAWRGIQLVRRWLIPTPQIRWTFTPETVEGLADDMKLFVEKYELFNIAVDAAYEVEWLPEDLLKLKAELEKLKKDYKVWMKQGKPVFSMFIRDANSSVTQKMRGWRSRCGLGEGAVGVDVDGTIYPCHRFVCSREIKIGHVSKGFSSERTKWIEKWRKLPPYSEIPEKCLKCKFKKACPGGCLALNFDLFGDLHVVPKTACEIKQLTVEVLGDLCLELQNNETFRRLYLRRQPRTCVE